MFSSSVYCLTIIKWCQRKHEVLWSPQGSCRIADDISQACGFPVTLNANPLRFLYRVNAFLPTPTRPPVHFPSNVPICDLFRSHYVTADSYVSHQKLNICILYCQNKSLLQLTEFLKPLNSFFDVYRHSMSLVLYYKKRDAEGYCWNDHWSTYHHNLRQEQDKSITMHHSNHHLHCVSKK